VSGEGLTLFLQLVILSSSNSDSLAAAICNLENAMLFDGASKSTPLDVTFYKASWSDCMHVGFLHSYSISVLNDDWQIQQWLHCILTWNSSGWSLNSLW